jgi:2-succinyl-6-hydroxy-2,4-cyclohexadiene-1-carboxylate synthase
VSAEVTTLDAGASTLAAAVRGIGPPVTVVHGFAQNRDCLGPLADALAADRRVLAPDAPGHGGSARHATAGLPAGARLLADTAGAGVYIGYSMGGRLCLRTALDHPDVVQALVLIGATAGIDDPDERAERRTADGELADRLERIGLDAFVAEWLDLPMFAGLPAWARFDDERRTNTAQGLAASLRFAGTGSMEPLWSRLGGIGVPVLCVTGSNDERYGSIAERLVGRIGPAARHVVVDGAGHAAHLEQPDAVVEAVLAFLDEAAPR